MDADIILEMNDIKKSFGALEVLNGISLSVRRGEVLVIIGPSGGGKSTLLRCATLLETIDAGSIRYLGETAAETGAGGKAVYAPVEKLRRIRSYFGLVFQNFNLFPHYTVLKNVTDEPIAVQKQSSREAETTARALLFKMGLSD